ncbi:MAG: hypothetical protein IJ019_01015 [Alphaproteobacteria bacterium]|nr:hypothetical protein [Alphaproteobacteria bacterium]
MDKLKIIKTTVFVLTFFVFFVLCLLVGKVLEKKTAKPFEIQVKNVAGAQIDNIKAVADYVYVQSSNQVHVVDVKNGTYKGVIFVTEEK